MRQLTSPKQVFDYSLDGYFVRLSRYHNLIDGQEVSPADDLYRLEFSGDYDDVMDQIPFHQAMLKIIDLLAGITESLCSNSASYPLSKAQLYAMATLYAQDDSHFLLNHLKNTHKIDAVTMRQEIIKKNIP